MEVPLHETSTFHGLNPMKIPMIYIWKGMNFHSKFKHFSSSAYNFLMLQGQVSVPSTSPGRLKLNAPFVLLCYKIQQQSSPTSQYIVSSV